MSPPSAVRLKGDAATYVKGDAATYVTFSRFAGNRPERCAAGSRCGSLASIMPRGPRLDAPGTLHHIMVRSIERTTIIRDDADRAEFLTRLAGVVERGTLSVFAWALLPNHAHLLLRTGARPLARSMRSLLTGYAGAFNWRHKRVGHLFQNRYRSVVVEEQPYLLELVRYIHLNPLRAKVVADRRALEQYPWAGHSALVGSVARPWQESATVLAQFGPTLPRARQAYRAFVAARVSQSRRPEYQGGRRVRSVGGWAQLAALRRAKEAVAGDARVLGGGDFVERLWREVQHTHHPPPPRLSLTTLVARVCRQTGVTPEELAGGGRRAAVTRARDGIAHLWVGKLGQSGRRLAPVLGIAPQSVYRAAARGATRASEWARLITR
jgi:putative transposase